MTDIDLSGINDIDLDGLEELDRLAKAHGMQVWAARIGLEGPGEIVVEDGEARSHGADSTQGDLLDAEVA